ncbi:hypothetical protein KSP40_PGU000486 [Platanthera guangdongensis]|uniref:Uncharacterized protein n=1 Tax=Platanthera guangdongensis TaxID=2320717 RepID=A0ABR2M6B4_9ASPA
MSFQFGLLCYYVVNIQVVLVPVTAILLLNTYAKPVVNAVQPIISFVAMFYDSLCIGSPLDINKSRILSSEGLLLLLSVVVFHLASFVLGYWASKPFLNKDLTGRTPSAARPISSPWRTHGATVSRTRPPPPPDSFRDSHLSPITVILIPVGKHLSPTPTGAALASRSPLSRTKAPNSSDRYSRWKAHIATTSRHQCFLTSVPPKATLHPSFSLFDGNLQGSSVDRWFCF